MPRRLIVILLSCAFLAGCKSVSNTNISNTQVTDKPSSSAVAEGYDVAVSGSYTDFELDEIAPGAVVKVVPAFGNEDRSDNFLNSIFGGRLKSVLNSLGVTCDIVDDQTAQLEMVNYDYMFSIAGYDLYTYETGGGISRVTILIDIYSLDSGDTFDMHINMTAKGNNLDTYTKSINNVADILERTLYTEWTK